MGTMNPRQKKRFNLAGPAIVAIVTGILLSLVGTCNAEEVFGIYYQEKDWIHHGLDFFFGKTSSGLSTQVGEGSLEIGITTRYTSQQRFMFVLGLICVVLVALSVICCCCCYFCAGRNQSVPPPPPVYIAPANANYPAAITSDAVVRAPLYPNFSTLTV